MLSSKLLRVFFFLMLFNQAWAYMEMFDEYPPNIEESYWKIDYLKIGGLNMTVGQENEYLPLVGFGRRYESNDTAIDYSATFGYAKGTEKTKRTLIFYSIPRIVCLKYTDPDEDASLYYGAGMSWSGVVNNKARQSFHGAFGEVAVGYEMQRKGNMRSFLQLDASQPILAASRKGKFPSTTLQLTFGLGF